MSAPPEVVFNTATDPDRASAWLPEPLRGDGSPAAAISAERAAGPVGSDAADWSAEIQVEPADAGGARVRLDLAGGSDGRPALADETLANLAREVADNLTAG